MRPRLAPAPSTRSGRIPEAVIADLVDRLVMNAEAVCRRYLSNGRREGAYWRVGDLANTPGRSLFVRLKSSAKGPAGKWTDAQSGEYGDLLDLIRLTRGLRSFPEAVAEARAFLGLPDEDPMYDRRGRRWRTCHRRLTATVGDGPPRAMHDRAGDESPGTTGNEGLTLTDSINTARRMFISAVPIAGTLAETYLRRRRITALEGLTALRFHPACLYRPAGDAEQDPSRGASETGALAWRGPALLAAVADPEGWITGVQRTWLDAASLLSATPLDNRLGKAALPDPRRSLGLIAGGAVRFPPVGTDCSLDVLLVGEGVETVLSLRAALPTVPMAAALSAGQLAGFALPQGLRLLLIAEDADPAGRAAAEALDARAQATGVAAVVLRPLRGDFNDDLRRDGAGCLLAHLRQQLAVHGRDHLCAAMR